MEIRESSKGTHPFLLYTEVNEIQYEEGVKSVAPPLQLTPLKQLYHMGWRSIAHDHVNGVIEAIFEFRF